VDCFPVVNFKRFFDSRPNGTSIMNVGACIPKKRMEDFVELALRVPELECNLYALGYKVAELREFATEQRSPVRFIPPVELEDMPAEYKKHRWLVYTAAAGGNVGWPLAIAEAQASGVGVCMANIRPDLREYAGPAGFLYDSLDKVVKLFVNRCLKKIGKPVSSKPKNPTFFSTDRYCFDSGACHSRLARKSRRWLLSDSSLSSSQGNRSF
jgi:hypothetical protein